MKVSKANKPGFCVKRRLSLHAGDIFFEGTIPQAKELFFFFAQFVPTPLAISETARKDQKEPSHTLSKEQR